MGIYGVDCAIYFRRFILMALYGVAAIAIHASWFNGYLRHQYVLSIRATDEEQAAGLDSTEIGVEAYPEFD